MVWYEYAAYFAGGLFLANCIPHLANGLSGRRFQTPFAKKATGGLSSPTVNALWGLLNLGFAWFLVYPTGKINLSNQCNVLTLGAGMVIMSFLLARAYGRIQDKA